MVLDGEPRQRPENINIQIPPIPAQAPRAGSRTRPAARGPSRGRACAQRGPGCAGACRWAPATAPAPPTAAPAETRAVAAGPSESLVIQIGCFSDAGKSRTLASQIKANKIPGFQ